MQNTLATALSSLVWTRKNLLLRSYAKELFTVWYCSQIQLHSFTPPLNSPTPAQRVAVDLSFKQNADRPVWKSLLEKAASCHAAAAKIFPPFSSAKARRVKFALRPPPGALYPHPSPNPNSEKVSRVGAVGNNWPKIIQRPTFSEISLNS